MAATSLGALLGVVAPVFALIGLGFVLGRTGLLAEHGRSALHRLVYYLALPADLVLAIGRSDVRAHIDPRALAASVAAYLTGLVATWLLTVRLEPGARGAVLNAAVRSNGAFIALPVATLLADSLTQARPPTADPLLGAHVREAFLIQLGVMVPLFNLGGVIGFLLPHHGLTRAGLRQALTQAMINPLLIACLVGIGCSWGRPLAPGWLLTLASLLLRPIALLAATAVPLALLVAGAQLDLALIRRRAGLVAAAAASKLLILPLGGWAIATALGVDGIGRSAVVLILAAPTAIAAIPMAALLGGDVELMTAHVTATTAIAPLTLLLWLVVLMAGLAHGQ